MRRFRRLLVGGEKPIVVTRMHGVRLLRPLLTLAILAAVGAWGALWLPGAGRGEASAPGWLQGTSLEGDAGLSVVTVGAAGLLVLLGLRPLGRVLRWRAHRLLVTDHRLVQVSGLLRKRISSVPLARISDVALRRSVLGRLLGYGELRVMAGNRVHRIGPLARPKGIHATVLSLMGPAAPAAPPAGQERPPPVAESPGRPGRVDEGVVLADRYLLVRRIAAGGMGTVYEAHDERLGRPIAIKLVREGAGHAESIERFRREARSAASLSHPNIASLFDYGEDDGIPYMVMELVRGSDLSHIIRAQGPFGTRRAGRICVQVLHALDHAHEMGVIHRDVKPANVIVNDDDRVKVTDFGIARAAGQTTLTSAGVLVGSAPYVSPEQVEGRRVTPQSDVYSSGILLFEMLTGSRPFEGTSALLVARRHLSGRVPPPSQLNRQVPGEIDRIVARATAKDPRDRFVSAGQMAVALARALEGRDDTTRNLTEGAVTSRTLPLSVVPRPWEGRAWSQTGDHA